MKKISAILFLILLLCGCSDNNTSQDSLVRYKDTLNLTMSYENLKTQSEYFALSGELSKINSGYRYYVFVDQPTSSLYNVKVLAAVEGKDYRNEMAASAGFFEENGYIMLPNQSDVEKGYVAGISVSGLCDSPNVVLRVLVQWENKDGTVFNRECYRLELNYAGK